MIQTKVFQGDDVNPVDVEINDWLKYHKDIKIISIKYSISTGTLFDLGNEKALLVYEIKE